MKKSNRKGFTIVELVIVIAVIAILAAVLIPTFSNIIKKANQSSDTQLIRNLNTALATDLALTGGTKYDTAHDAFKAADEAGYDVAKIVAKSEYNIAYELSKGRFVLLDTATNTYLYPVDTTNNETGTVSNKADYFVVCATEADANGYSVYVGPNWSATDTDVVLDGQGFDAGDCTTITTVNYTNNASGATAKDVVIRTNSFETVLTINAFDNGTTCDKVTHYDYAAIVNADTVGHASYHEYGTVGRLKVADGKAVLEDGAVVVCPMDLDGTAESAKIVVETGATIYTEGNYSQNDDGVANQAVSDCGAGHHDFGEKIVVDATHMYEVCKCCGYTLITVEDDLGNQTKQTKNTINGDDVIENVTPIATYATTSTITSLETGKNYTVGEVISEPETIKADVKDDGCEHEFVGVVTTEATCTSTGIKTYTCSKCGSSYTMSLPLGRHHYVVKENDKTKEVCKDCSVEKSTNVCKIGDTEYATVPLAVKYLTDNSITAKTTITLIDDETLVYNQGITILDGYNVVIDLNGYTIGCASDGSYTSNLIANYGTLTIQDSTDKTKDGSGTGIITSYSESPDKNAVPGYASNTILNRGGTLYVLSGTVECNTSASAAYAIDNSNNSYGDTYCYIRGGKIIASATAIRNASWCTDVDYLDISNAIVGKVWQYTSQANAKAEIKINNSTLTKGLLFGYIGDSDNINISISNSTVTGDVVFRKKYVDCSISNTTINGYFVEYGENYCNITSSTYSDHIVGAEKVLNAYYFESKNNITALNDVVDWTGYHSAPTAYVGYDYSLDTSSCSFDSLSGKAIDIWYCKTVGNDDYVTSKISNQYIHINGKNIFVDSAGIRECVDGESFLIILIY